jgi:DNA-binding MarR family transcriptional regulator
MYTADSLSITEITTLGYLYQHQSLFPSELAAMAKVKTQSMSQVLNHLTEQKLISRTASAKDKRKTAVSLTAFGKKMLEQTRYERDEWLANAILYSLSIKEQKFLAMAIPIIDKLADFT